MLAQYKNVTVFCGVICSYGSELLVPLGSRLPISLLPCNKQLTQIGKQTIAHIHLLLRLPLLPYPSQSEIDPCESGISEEAAAAIAGLVQLGLALWPRRGTAFLALRWLGIGFDVRPEADGMQHGCEVLAAYPDLA